MPNIFNTLGTRKLNTFFDSLKQQLDILHSDDGRDNEATKAGHYYDAPSHGMSGLEYEIAAEEAMEYSYTPTMHSLSDKKSERAKLLRKVKDLMNELDSILQR